MRTSHDAQELAKVKYIRQAQEISKTHYENIQRHRQSLSRGGAMAGAIDREHLAMLRKLCDLYAQTQLESFLADGLIPDENDFKEILNEMERIVSSSSEFWTPRPATNELLTRLAQSVYVDFVNQVRQMALEQKLQKPARPSYSVNIQADVIGGVQVGSGNTQNIEADDETTS